MVPPKMGAPAPPTSGKGSTVPGAPASKAAGPIRLAPITPAQAAVEDAWHEDDASLERAAALAFAATPVPAGHLHTQAVPKGAAMRRPGPAVLFATAQRPPAPVAKAMAATLALSQASVSAAVGPQVGPEEHGETEAIPPHEVWDEETADPNAETWPEEQDAYGEEQTTYLPLSSRTILKEESAAYAAQEAAASRGGEVWEETAYSGAEGSYVEAEPEAAQSHADAQWTDSWEDGQSGGYSQAASGYTDHSAGNEEDNAFDDYDQQQLMGELAEKRRRLQASQPEPVSLFEAPAVSAAQHEIAQQAVMMQRQQQQQQQHAMFPQVGGVGLVPSAVSAVPIPQASMQGLWR